MGGRGSYALSIKTGTYDFTYQTMGFFNGIKIVNPVDVKRSLKLPEESHSSNAYILFDKKGVFHQYREYNENHKVVLEIGYHQEASLGKGKILHVHYYNTPGVENRGLATKEKIYPGHAIYEKYKYLFKGV